MLNLMPRRRERTTAGVPTRRDYTPFDLLRQDFASLFDRALPTWAFAPSWDEPLGFDIEEKENELVLHADVPGFDAKDLDISVRGNMLILRAEHTATEKGKAVERRHARLEQTVNLPSGVDPEQITAACRNGVLEVHVPLKAEAKPRRIEVKPKDCFPPGPFFARAFFIAPLREGKY